MLAFGGEVTRQATPLWAQGYLVCDGSPLLVSELDELFLMIGRDRARIRRVSVA